MIKILISAEGGQGGQVLAELLCSAAYKAGFKVSQMPHYGVEKRGGISLSYVIISKSPISDPKFSSADIIVATTWRQIEIPKNYQKHSSIIINGQALAKIIRGQKLNYRSLNMAILGILVNELKKCGISLNEKRVEKLIIEKFKNKSDFTDNINAFNLGLDLERSKYNLSLETILKPQFNPISTKVTGKQYFIFPNLCKGCGLCVEVCPVKALDWSEENINFLGRTLPRVDITKCIACKRCQNICPECAIKVVKSGK
ncbi:MAG: 2-oxoacid:acceptor oxidoreductase family protein [Patescibacteria group bacterium]|nr:2-oxoacid:acceptor oxidoreductase family protein [Patescibacteria group bacterium]